MTSSSRRDLRISARVRPTTAAKIARLRRATGQSTTEVLTRAVDKLHDEMISSDSSAAMEKFIGCAEADPELSSNYKHELTQSLQAKHGHR